MHDHIVRKVGRNLGFIATSFGIALLALSLFGRWGDVEWSESATSTLGYLLEASTMATALLAFGLCFGRTFGTGAIVQTTSALLTLVIALLFTLDHGFTALHLSGGASLIGSLLVAAGAYARVHGESVVDSRWHATR